MSLTSSNYFEWQWNARDSGSMIAQPVTEPRILMVAEGNDANYAVVAKLLLNKFQVDLHSDEKVIIDKVKSFLYSIVILDKEFTSDWGMNLLRHINENNRETDVIVLAGEGCIADAVLTLRAGAEEYLPEPVDDETLTAAILNCREKRLTVKAQGKECARALVPYFGLIFSPTHLLAMNQIITRAAASHAHVLITGESGTGKELIARAIHQSGPRAGQPFIAINCAAIPESLLESELFGHVKGSFTGALETRPGFFQAARGGTILLDEISETSVAMQVKLLRVLQNKEIQMVGSRETLTSDARVICARNKNLIQLTEKGLFRQDLYYRINIISISLPALRKRGPEDIVGLVHYFMGKYSKEMGKACPDISPQVRSILTRYEWPGNIRELENLIQKFLWMHLHPVIEITDLPENLRYSIADSRVNLRSLAEMEVMHIRQVLSHVNGNKSKAADLLGINRKTLLKKLTTEIPKTE